MLSEKIKALVGETDKLDELKDLMSEADSYETQLAEARNIIAERDEKIASLRDTNAKLFLSVTKPSDEPEEAPEPDYELEHNKLLDMIQL